MADKDAITKQYMKDAKIFADAFNFLLYDGKNVICPSRLRTMDTAEIVLPFGEGQTASPVQKYRDNLKYLAAMEDETAAYAILGLEGQSDIHYAMPVRDMLYDAMQYAKQVEKAAKSHRDAAKAKAEKRWQDHTGSAVSQKEHTASSGEYLSGFYKNDRLVPVITLVILFSPKPWDGPMSIHEMLSDVKAELLPFIPDYRINLIAPADMSEASLDKFNTSLREVLLYIKYSSDKKQLSDLLDKDPHFRELDTEAAVVINTLTNSKLKFDRKGKTVNMCLAVQAMRQEERQEGRLEGRLEGRQEGESRINQLNSLLIDLNRFEDLKRAAKDSAYQAELMAELLPNQ